MVVIEHNLDVVKTADWILDLGPEGGDGGGRIVAEGTPEDVAASAASHTGRFLRHHFARARRKAGRLSKRRRSAAAAKQVAPAAAAARAPRPLPEAAAPHAAAE